MDFCGTLLGQDSDGGRSVSLGASEVEGSERNHMNQAKAGDMTRNVIEHKEQVMAIEIMQNYGKTNIQIYST